MSHQLQSLKKLLMRQARGEKLWRRSVAAELAKNTLVEVMVNLRSTPANGEILAMSRGTIPPQVRG